MGRTARLTPLSLIMVAAVACAELRVAGGGPGLDDAEAAEAGAVAKDAGADVDAPVMPDVAEPDGQRPTATCDGPCPPERIVEGLVQATAITVDATNVYFATESGNGTVYQCPKTGCDGAPIELGSGYTTSIAVVDGVVYWGDFAAGKVQSCAVGGCGKIPTAIVSNETAIKGVVSDGVHLFWGTGDGDVRRCPIATCSTATVETIATGQGFISSLAADQGKVFWPNLLTSTVYASPVGSTADPMALGPGSHSVSTYAGKVY